MANTLSDITKVIIAETLDTLREEATGVKIFQNDLKGAAMEQGQIINVPLPVAQTTYSVTPAATPPALVDITKTKAQIALTNWKASRFNLTNKDCAEITNAGDLVKSQIKECARAIVKDVNTSILGKYTGISNYSGTAGTTPFASTVQAAIDARRELNRVFAPDNDRYGIIDYNAEANALALSAFTQWQGAGPSGQLSQVEGFLGKRFGIEWLRDSQVPTHTTGAATGYVVNFGAGYAAGTTQLVIGTGTGAWVEGDIVKFANHAQTYAVDAGSTTTLLKLKKPLVTAVVDTEAIAKKASHVVNLVCNKNAFAVVARPLVGGTMSSAVGMEPLGDPVGFVDPFTGLPLTLSIFKGYNAVQVELSLLYGADVLDERCGSRMAG